MSEQKDYYTKAEVDDLIKRYDDILEQQVRHIKQYDTPRTDAAITHFDLEEYCLADEARKLERELNAANERIKQLETAGNNMYNELFSDGLILDFVSVNSLEAWKELQQ